MCLYVEFVAQIYVSVSIVYLLVLKIKVLTFQVHYSTCFSYSTALILELKFEVKYLLYREPTKFYVLASNHRYISFRTLFTVPEVKYWCLICFKVVSKVLYSEISRVRIQNIHRKMIYTYFVIFISIYFRLY